MRWLIYIEIHLTRVQAQRKLQLYRNAQSFFFNVWCYDACTTSEQGEKVFGWWLSSVEKKMDFKVMMSRSLALNLLSWCGKVGIKTTLVFQKFTDQNHQVKQL